MNKPGIDLIIKPMQHEGPIGLVSVAITAALDGKAGQRLFSINRRVTNKSFTKLQGEIAISDTLGTLSCTIGLENPLHIERECFIPDRDSVGLVEICYTVMPEAVKDNPCFDLGFEPDGINGSGMTFLPLFECGPCRITVDWDLSSLMSGARGIWSFGEGKVTVFDNPSVLQETFYYAGIMRSVENGNFGFYWFDYPDFEIKKTAEYARDAFLRMAEFFKDDGKPYRIFTRRGSSGNRGGTALTRSYQFIYSAEFKPAPEQVKFLFAHEMVHNWGKMHDEPFGTTTWFSEGTAEYYSALLPWKQGLVSRDELVEELNRRAKVYYENPYIHVENSALGKQLFSNIDVTRVPYGRGFFYLLRIDAQIREASSGTMTLDNIILSLKRETGSGPLPENKDWLNLIVPLLGESAEEDFRAMQGGDTMVPAAACFHGEIGLQKTTGTVRGTGDPCDLWVFV